MSKLIKLCILNVFRLYVNYISIKLLKKSSTLMIRKNTEKY